jgi:hypothetical protein
MIHPRPYQDWIKFDLDWILKCDYLLRLDGESKGADDEVGFASEHNIPVFYQIEAMVRFNNREFREKAIWS